MTRRLPPLLSIRYFESAARYSSFVRAGEELCVSSGAVGHQIRLLEEWVGCALFVRGARSVELNEAGRRYFLEIGPLMDELEGASLSIRNAADDAEVTITAMPSFVTRWLLPRLGKFRTLHPQIEVRLLASVPPVDFAKDRVDLAIRLGGGSYVGMITEVLLPETYHAVANIYLRAELNGPEDVLSHTLLHDEYESRIPEQVDWQRWCTAQRVHAPTQRLRRGLRFSHTYLTLDAATAGEGVAVTSDVLAGDAVERGQLVPLPGVQVKGPYQYHLLRPHNSGSRPQVGIFCEWLRQEADSFLQRNASLWG